MSQKTIKHSFTYFTNLLEKYITSFVTVFIYAPSIAISFQEYISIESMQLPETAFLHIDVTSNSANPISGGVVV